MSFNFSVSFSDPNQSSDPQDAILLQAMNDALNAWSRYIAGSGTLIVKLGLAPFGLPDPGNLVLLADGGPTRFSYAASGSITVATPADVTALTTGQHIADSDITVTFNSQLLPTVTSEQSYDLLPLMEHELMHGFGMTGFYKANATVGATRSPYDANVAVQPGGLAYFTGSAAEAVYGGPVPLTTSFLSSNIYHLGPTGAASDPASERNDLMYPVQVNPNATISALDVAILRDSGVPIAPLGYVLMYPNATIAASTGSANGAAVTDPLITGTTMPDEPVGIFLGSAQIGSALADGNGAWSFRPSGLGDGAYTLRASIFGGASANATLLLDATTPVVVTYQQVIGAAPSDAQVATARQSLVTGTPLSTIRADIATSAAAAVALQSIYAATVNRAATPADIARNEAELANGATLASERLALATSGEERTAIQAMFQDALGRGVLGDDVARVTGELASGATLADERSALATSAEALVAIASIFQDTVGRAAFPADGSRLQGELSNGATMAGERMALVNSGEEQAAIQSMFQNAVGRGVLGNDLMRVTSELANGATLAGERSALATSAEAAGMIKSIFQDTVGRPASPADHTRLQGELAGGATMAGERMALVGSVEEQTAIQAMFQNTVGRGVLGDDLARVTSELANGATLASEHFALATSTEALNAIARVYVAATGVAPTVPQMAASQAELSSSTTLAQLTPLLVSQEGMYIIDARTASTAFHTSKSDLFVLDGRVSHQIPIGGFDVAQDIVQFSSSVVNSFGAVLAASSPISAGFATTLDFGNFELAIVGVATTQLHASNFQFV